MMTDFDSSEQDIMDKLSEPIEPSDDLQEESQEDSDSEEETTSATDGDDDPGDARSDEEHGASEAPTEEDPTDALPAPTEDRIYAGRYKDPESLEQAYQHLEMEFTRRNQVANDTLVTLEEKVRELGHSKAALEFQLWNANHRKELSPEKLEDLREKANRWGVDEEMLIEQERKELERQSQASSQAAMSAIQQVGQQAGIYIQQHPNAQHDIGVVTELLQANEGLMDVLHWQDPGRLAKSMKGLIDLMYEAAEGRRLRGQVAQIPNQMAGVRQQVRQEVANQQVRKNASVTVASTAKAKSPKLGSGAQRGFSDAKAEILDQARRNRNWYKD
jgi:hypothetical protein